MLGRWFGLLWLNGVHALIDELFSTTADGQGQSDRQTAACHASVSISSLLYTGIT